MANDSWPAGPPPPPIWSPPDPAVGAPPGPFQDPRLAAFGVPGAPMPPASGSPATPSPRWGMGDVLLGLAFWLGFQLVVGIGLAIAFAASGDLSDEELTQRLTEPTAPFVALLVSGGWLAFGGWPTLVSYWKGTRSVARDFGLAITGRDALWGVGVWGAFFVVQALLGIGYAIVTGGDEPPDNTQVVSEAIGSWADAALLFVFVAIGTPIAEELFFRGLFLRAASNRWTPAIGAIVSGVGFGLLHFQGTGVGELWVLGLLSAFGIMLGFVTLRREGRIGAAIVAHMCNNGLAVVVLAYGALS